jgi:hypothetical protein
MYGLHLREAVRAARRKIEATNGLTCVADVAVMHHQLDVSPTVATRLFPQLEG